MMHRTAGDLARFLNCPVEGEASVLLRGVASPERASAEDLIYVDSPRQVSRARDSAAGCVIALPALAILGKTVIFAAHPKLMFSRAAEWLNPPAPIAQGIHSTAVVASSAVLARGAAIGPFVVVEEGAEIGEGSEVGAFSFIGRNAKIGSGCRLYPRVTLYAGVQLQDRVIIHAGAVLGADGFGYVTHDGRHWKFPQAGNLEIGSDAEIGANTTIDRGSLDTTRIGEQVKLDNLVHVAHNVQIGDRTLIAAQTGIAGSCLIGSDVVIGGQAGLGDHCRVEDRCMVGGQAGVLNGKTIQSGVIVWGTPARPLDRVKKLHAWYARLPEIAERVSKLEKIVDAQNT